MFARGFKGDAVRDFTAIINVESVRLWRENMEYIMATPDMANAIHNILHTSIRTVYPKYYPQEVAEFFCQLHSKAHILEGIASGNMGVLMDGDVGVGVGCFDGNHITGVYVLPSYQKQG